MYMFSKKGENMENINKNDVIHRMKERTEVITNVLFSTLLIKILHFNSIDEALSDANISLIDIEENKIYSVFTGDHFITNGLNSDEAVDYDNLIYKVSKNTISPVYSFSYLSYMDRDNMKKTFYHGLTMNSLEYMSRRADGYKWFYSSYLLEKDEESGKLFAFLMVFEYDRFRRAQDEMMNMALRDQLTGLFNRYKLQSEIKDYLEFNKEHSAVLIAFDLNKFKEINDNYGHQAGDRALLAMAERLEKCFYNRNQDYLFREGGDEFLVFLEKTNEDTALNKINHMLEKPISIKSDGRRAEQRADVQRGGLRPGRRPESAVLVFESTSASVDRQSDPGRFRRCVSQRRPAEGSGAESGAPCRAL